jgi:hypothetical protein
MLPAELEPQIAVAFVVQNPKTKERYLEWSAEHAFDFIAGLMKEYGNGAKDEFLRAIDLWKRRV